MPDKGSFQSGYPFVLVNGVPVANPASINFKAGAGVTLVPLFEKGPNQVHIEVVQNSSTASIQVVTDIADATASDGAQALVETGDENIRMTYSDSEGKWISDDTHVYTMGVIAATGAGVFSVGGTYYNSTRVDSNAAGFAYFASFDLEGAHDAGLEPEFRVTTIADQIAAQTITGAIITHVQDDNSTVATTSALFAHKAVTGTGGGNVVSGTGPWTASPTHAAVKHNLLIQHQAATSSGTNGNLQGSSVEVRWVNGDITT